MKTLTDYLGGLTVSQGRLAGQPFEVLPWQRCFIRGAFREGVQSAALDRFGRPSIVAADRWREAELRDALDKAGIPPAAFEARGMGFQDGGADDLRSGGQRETQQRKSRQTPPSRP